MNKKILIVEDEDGLRLGLSDTLEAESYDVTAAEDGQKGLDFARSGEFDLIILDMMLPYVDGLTIAKTLRAENFFVPIIALTAKNQLEDKVTGLRSGVDDYMTKPFEISELLARIEVQIRRGEVLKNAVVVTSHNQNLQIDLQRGYVVANGVEQQLLEQEIKLLNYFYQHDGEAISRKTLLETVWDYRGGSTTRTIDVHISRLRQKLGDVDGKYIQTVRGIGYRFVMP